MQGVDSVRNMNRETAELRERDSIVTLINECEDGEEKEGRASEMSDVSMEEVDRGHPGNDV